jgi:malonyl-CoA O-methyltransferase
MTDESILMLEPQAAYQIWAGSYPPYAHNPLMKAEERALLALLPTDLHTLKVLDAGCGSGRYMLHAQQRGAAEVIGIDLTYEMLCRARAEGCHKDRTSSMARTKTGLVQAGIEAIPLADCWANLTLCGLTLGHVPDLAPALAELHRVTKQNGVLLCSDFHPIGETLGWRRDFKADGKRCIVRHKAHTLETWHAACRKVGLRIEQVAESYIDVADIPAGATFEPSGLRAPVALILALRRGCE